MRIDDNAEALAMMKNTLGSLEGKFREAYNKGFYDGRKEGRNEAKQEIANRLLKEVEDESNCSEKPNNCETCIWSVCNYNKAFEDEPQMDYTPDCPFCKRYGTEDCLGSDCRHYKTYKTEPQTETSTNSEKVQLTDEPQTDDLIKQADVLIDFEKEWLEMDEEQTDCCDTHGRMHKS